MITAGIRIRFSLEHVVIKVCSLSAFFTLSSMSQTRKCEICEIVSMSLSQSVVLEPVTNYIVLCLPV